MLSNVFANLHVVGTMKDGFEMMRPLFTSSFIDKILCEALSRGGEFAEIYAEYSVLNGISLEENKIRQAQSGVRQGIGIRVIQGEKTGYAYTERFEISDLLKAAGIASYIAANRSGKNATRVNVAPQAPDDMSPIKVYPDGVEIKKKADLLWSANNAAFERDRRIYQVEASLWDGARLIAIANSEGLLTGDQRVMSRFNVTAYARDGDNRQAGRHSGGGRIGFEYFDRYDPKQHAEEAVRQALILLEAREAPAGPQTVILGNGWAGVLLHEAIGHGLEADFNRKGTSLYANRIGQKVASELCTIVDDGTIPNLRGTINIDDEGIRSERKILIENGILKGYMADRLNAGLMGIRPTGSGRRESYQHYPIPRMTNTFMLPGEYTPEEIISSVKKGLYAKSFAGGQVDISNGQFVFEITEGYMIEDGRIAFPVRGASLIGSGPEILQRVVMVGSDLEYDPGVGTCGKDGQTVPVGVGLPTCKISEITVGGTAVDSKSMFAGGI